MLLAVSLVKYVFIHIHTIENAMMIQICNAEKLPRRVASTSSLRPSNPSGFHWLTPR